MSATAPQPMPAEVRAILDRAVAERAFPGTVFALGRPEGTLSLSAHGHLTYAADAACVTAATIYDLASLTKVVATTAAAMLLCDDGRLELDLPAQRLVPELRGPGKEGVTLAHLLAHTAGIEWWAPLYRELSGQQAYLERVGGMPLTHPPGVRSVYSDFGFIVLGAALERLAGEPLAELVRRRLFEPLGMGDTSYCPAPTLKARIAPTELCPWRGRLIHGEVHDENAFAMGGIAPQAGLFSTAGDLACLAQLLLARGERGGRRLLKPETVELFTHRTGIPGSTRALGWDTPNDSGYSTAGSLMSRRSFGHVGFTGTSLWMDPERQVFVILLSNRIHPTRKNEAIRDVRPAVTDAALRALGG